MKTNIQLENISEKEICQIYDIRYNTFGSLKRDFLKKIRNSEDPAELFFASSQVGKREKRQPEIEAKIMALRKKNLSVPDIKAILSSEDIHSAVNRRKKSEGINIYISRKFKSMVV